MALSTAAGEGCAPVLGPASGCLWGEEEKLGFPLPWGGTSLGRSVLLKVFCLESPGKINPFVNRTLPGSLPGSAGQDPASAILADAPAPRNQQAVQTLVHSDRQTGTLGRGPTLTFQSPCNLPSSPGAPPVQLSHCAPGAQTPPPLPGGPGLLLGAPSRPLSQGFPRPRGTGASSSHWRGAPSTTRQSAGRPHSGAALPASAVCPRTPPRSLCPSPSHLDAGL